MNLMTAGRDITIPSARRPKPRASGDQMYGIQSFGSRCRAIARRSILVSAFHRGFICRSSTISGDSRARHRRARPSGTTSPVGMVS